MGWLIHERALGVSRACRAVSLGRSSYYHTRRDPSVWDAPLIDRLNEVLTKHPRWGFWKCFHWMRLKGESWNHKRVLRVYRAMKLHRPRRAKRRLPARVKEPLNAPAQAGLQWSMDFMHDALWCGRRFRTLNVFDEGVREALAIEVDTSLPAERVIRLLDQLKDSHRLPQQIRVDNGPELVSAKLVAWCEEHGIKLHHIQPGRPMQNGYVERFNRSFRHEVLDAHVFTTLSQVRECVHEWLISYNEERPHKSLNNLPPALFRQQQSQLQTHRQSQPNTPPKL